MSFTKEGYSILFKSVMYYKQTHLLVTTILKEYNSAFLLKPKHL